MEPPVKDPMAEILSTSVPETSFLGEEKSMGLGAAILLFCSVLASARSASTWFNPVRAYVGEDVAGEDGIDYVCGECVSMTSHGSY